MNNRILLGIILVLTIFSLSVKAEQVGAPECDADTIIKDLHERLSTLTSYKLKTDVRFMGESAKAEIIGKQPDRLKITMAVDSRSGPRRSKAIFDGTHQWVQKGESSEAQVLKIDLRKTTSDQRPFDTGYYMMGSGLLNGEGFPSTVRNLTSLYELEAKCNESRIQLAGPLLPDQFEEFADKRNTTQSDGKLVERFKKQFGYLNLTLSSNNHMIKGYSIGPSPEKAQINASFSEINLNPKLEDNTFDYNPPNGTKAQDITDLVLNRRQSN